MPKASLAAIVCLLMLVGCASSPQPQSSTGTERYQVAAAALRYFVEKDSGHDVENGCSAYVIAPGEFSSRLPAEFVDHKPPVVTNIQVSTDSGRNVDKATGKSVKLWSVEVVEIHRNRATAKISWHSGNLAAGGHTVHLRRTKDKWIVVSEKLDWIS